MAGISSIDVEASDAVQLTTSGSVNFFFLRIGVRFINFRLVIKSLALGRNGGNKVFILEF